MAASFVIAAINMSRAAPCWPLSKQENFFLNALPVIATFSPTKMNID
jgi:hypothetical protein